MEKDLIIFWVITITIVFTIGFLIYVWFPSPYESYNFCWDKGYDYADYFEKEGKITCISYYQGEKFQEEYKVTENYFGIKEINGGIKLTKDKE